MAVTLDDIYNLPESAFIAGDTKTFEVFVTDENGAPLDLNGSTCSIRIFPLGQNDILIIALSGDIVDAQAGEFHCTLESDDSSELSGKYIAQVFVTDIDGIEHIPCQGILTISPKSL